MRVACKNCNTCILCFFGTVRVPIVHFQKDFDNFDCKPFRPPAFLTPYFWLEPKLLGKMAKNDFFRFARKYSINRKNKLYDPYKAFCNHCGSNFSKKNFGRKKIFWTPLTEKTGKKTSKMAKNSIFEA